MADTSPHQSDLLDQRPLPSESCDIDIPIGALFMELIKLKPVKYALIALAVAIALGAVAAWFSSK